MATRRRRRLPATDRPTCATLGIANIAGGDKNVTRVFRRRTQCAHAPHLAQFGHLTDRIAAIIPWMATYTSPVQCSSGQFENP